MIEEPSAPRAGQVGPAGESGTDAFDFMGFERFGHMNGTSRVCLELHAHSIIDDEGIFQNQRMVATGRAVIVAPGWGACYRPKRSQLDSTREASGERSD